MTLPPPDTQTVLIVDDIPANLNLLRGVLEPEGFRVLGATSGGGALNILQRTVPDLILLDVSMPEMDGFETCRRLKQLEGVNSIPVVFITARHEIEAVVEGFKCGAADYLTKPFNREEVIVRVKAHLENSRLQRLLRERNLELERVNGELTRRQQQLEEALGNIKTLRGLIPICSYCKKIRDDKGFWERVESYLKKHSEASFSHSICPECLREHFPDFARGVKPE
jgi:DNA-binding response OmpR family regulator